MRKFFLSLCLLLGTLAAQEVSVEKWLEELSKARDPDLKTDYDWLDENYKKLDKEKLLKALEQLVKTSPHGRVMAKSLNYIKELGDEGLLVIPLLQTCLSDLSDGTRQKALPVLRSVYKSGANQEKYKDIFPQLANILVNDWRSDIRTICAQTIEKMDAKELIYVCILGLDDFNKNTRGQSFLALKKVAKPDQVLFINQVKEWKEWFETNKGKYPEQIIPPEPKLLAGNAPEVMIDIASPQKTLETLAGCVEKENVAKLDDIWCKKNDKNAHGSPSEEEIKESERNTQLYYGTFLPLYQRLAKRLLKEKPKNESEDGEKAVFMLSQPDRLDRVRRVSLLKEYKAIEIFIASGASASEIEKAKEKCKEALENIQFLATTPEEVESTFEEKAKELADPEKNQKRNLIKYFVLKEFDPEIEKWFKSAKINEISPIFARERGASCFLFLEIAWRFDHFEPHFSE
ncbi:MAG: peptidylprolyl isomerase [Planctomycetota bacterium]